MSLLILILLGVLANWAAVSAASLVQVRLDRNVSLGAAWWVMMAAFCLLLEGIALVVAFIPFWASEKIFSSPGQGASFVALAWIIAGPGMCFLALPAVYAIVTLPNLGRRLRYFGPPAVLLGLLALFNSGGFPSLPDEEASGAGVIPLLEFLGYVITFPLTWIGFVAAVDWAATRLAVHSS